MSVILFNTKSQLDAIRTAVQIAVDADSQLLAQSSITIWLDNTVPFEDVSRARDYLISRRIPYLWEETVAVYSGFGSPVIKLSDAPQILTAFALLGNAMAYSARYREVEPDFDPFDSVVSSWSLGPTYSTTIINSSVCNHPQPAAAFAYTVLSRLRYNTVEAEEFTWEPMGPGAEAFGKAAYEIINRMLSWVTDSALFLSGNTIL